ncbi:MAG: ABC transporter permease [Phycisphaerales bacterium]
MIAKLRESPSIRKLVRNRRAMVALGIISLYLFVFVWIVAMQFVSLIGSSTGKFDLSDRPVLGALLPENTLTRVGPRNMPGFGLVAEPGKRTEQARFYFDYVGEALDAIENKLETDDRSDEEILREKDLAEKRLADLPTAALREIHQRGAEEFKIQSELRTLRSKFVQVEFAVTNVRKNAELFSNSAPGEEQDVMLDEISLSLEEVAILLDEASDAIPADSALAEIDLLELEDQAAALFDEPTPDPLYDAELLNLIDAAVGTRLEGIDAEVDARLANVEPILAELYPMPGGVKGALYKIRLMLGTDRQGRSILIRAVYSAKVAIQVGLVVSLIAVAFGSVLGAAAGYFGGIADHLIIWLYSTFSSIPYLVLLVVLAFMFTGSRFEGTLIPLYSAFCLTYWIGPCRVTRGEALKLKELDFVQAANALGAGKARILLKHIIPNTAHLMFINLSLLFIGAIKGEVVLTFLGLGLKEGASWGIMINQSKSEVVSGFFWQIGAATFFMFVLVLAFNVLTDALQDAFDPKHVA